MPFGSFSRHACTNLEAYRAPPAFAQLQPAEHHLRERLQHVHATEKIERSLWKMVQVAVGEACRVPLAECVLLREGEVRRGARGHRGAGFGLGTRLKKIE